MLDIENIGYYDYLAPTFPAPAAIETDNDDYEEQQDWYNQI